MKRALYCAAVIFFAMLVVAGPASAQSVTRESSCTEVHGSNTMTYDCGYNVKNYAVGTPVTFTINYNCTSGCGPVLSFGLRNNGFSPPGVSGHLVGGKRIPNGVELTFVFDSLRKDRVGNAHFNLNINMDDGSGTWSATPCKVNVHLMD